MDLQIFISRMIDPEYIVRVRVTALCGWLTSAPDEKYTVTKGGGEERRGEEYLISANIAVADVMSLLCLTTG